MTAASVLGWTITPERAAACRELLAGVASRGSWELVEPLLGAAFQVDAAPVRGPDGAILTRAPLLVHALASCALGSACARCSTPIEEGGDVLDDGWCCSGCVARQRAVEDYRRRAAMWLRRGNQVGLFGVEPATARRRRRR